MRKLVRGPRGVRSLAYLASIEKRPKFRESRICETRRVYSHVACLLRVFSRCLVVPQSKHRCEGTPLLFLRPAAVPSVKLVARRLKTESHETTKDRTCGKAILRVRGHVARRRQRLDGDMARERIVRGERKFRSRRLLRQGDDSGGD